MGRGTPLRLPYRHWTEIVSGFGEPDGTPPLRIARNTPGKKSTDFRNWGRLGGSPVKFNSKISLSLSLSLSLAINYYHNYVLTFLVPSRDAVMTSKDALTYFNDSK